jgi:hypothetical protein
MKRLFTGLLLTGVCFAQEASSGLDVAATVTGGGSYSHQLADGPADGGFRAVIYPTLKLGSHWSFTGAVQIRSAPFFAEEFALPNRRLTASPLQAHLDYSRFAKNRSIVVRAGFLQSAFGSFLLRYDDAVNPLTQSPQAYGYAYRTVSTLGMAGVQLDATLGSADFRAQFVNSSPANRRSIFDRDQYGNWAGGAGYTIRQGFRVGVSAYRGPYLSRDYPYYFPGESAPRGLPGSAYGIDVQWARGPWSAYGELQRFQMIYRAIPDFNEHTGYAELRRVLTPRWYAAARVEYVRANAFPGYQAYEMAAGLRLNTHQLVKLGYQVQQGPAIRGTLSNVAAIQLVTSFRALSLAR